MAVPTSNGSSVGEIQILSGQKAWRWDGTVWKSVRFIPPVASGGTEVDQTNPDGDGKNYHKHTFTSNGTLTVSVPGYVNALIVGRGSSGYNGQIGSGGRVFEGLLYLPAGSHSITVPGAASNVDGYGSGIGTVMFVGSVKPGPSAGAGAGYMTGSGSTGWTSTISGSSVEYARSVSTSVNPGDSGPSAGAVVAGIVIIRYER